jgi:hypothetical protein
MKEVLEKNFYSFARYETFIVVGFIMAVSTFSKLLGFINFSSDWLWFLAGVGLVVEGSISLVKQRKFDKKYKIIER